MMFGELIASRRKALGLSQKELAARIRREDDGHISPQYLNDLERNRRNPPSEYLLRQFAQALDLPSEFLFYVVGQLPEDLRDQSDQPGEVVAAFRAFRKTLIGHEA